MRPVSFSARMVSEVSALPPGSQQIPWQKLSKVGDRIACGESGDLSITSRMVDALRSSRLASEPTISLAADECLRIAREAVANWTTTYLQHVVVNRQLPLDEHRATLLIAGVAGDRNFAYSVNWLGYHGEPDSTHYKAIGSGAQSARIYLDAYEYFVLPGRPVLSLEALAARVMERVAQNNVDVGGDLSLVAIHRETDDEHPDVLEETTPDDPAVRGAISHWELLESAADDLLFPLAIGPGEAEAQPSEPSADESTTNDERDGL